MGSDDSRFRNQLEINIKVSITKGRAALAPLFPLILPNRNRKLLFFYLQFFLARFSSFKAENVCVTLKQLKILSFTTKSDSGCAPGTHQALARCNFTHPRKFRNSFVHFWKKLQETMEGKIFCCSLLVPVDAFFWVTN
jgi:hypothetical protein